MSTCLGLCACPPASQLDLAGPSTVSASFAVVAPTPPTAPTPPRFLPCPTGWLERGADPVTCAPWPNDTAEQCDANSAHFVGDAHCTTVGSACPSGEWPDSFPGGRPVLFVSASATSNGDGTRTAPFNSVAAAFLASSPGTLVALGKGTHVIGALVPGGISLVGACAAMTTVTKSTTTAPRVEVYVKSAGVEVKNLRVQGTGVGLQVEGAAATVDVWGVIFDGVSGYGISAVQGGHATLHDVVIRNTLPLSVVQGRGLEIALGGVVEGTRVVVDGSLEVGVHVTGATSRVTLVDAAVTGSGGAASSTGYGFRVEVGAQAQLTRVMVSGNHDEGISATDGAVVTLTDVVVRDTLPAPGSGAFGDGIAAHASTVTGTRVRLEHNSHSGVVSGTGSTVTLEDVFVADTQPERLQMGLGMLANNGGHLTVSRGVLRRSTALGAGASDPGSSLALTDVVVDDTRVSPGSTSAAVSGGDGIGTRGGAGLTLNRVAVRFAHSFGIEVVDPTSRLDAKDVSISDTLEGFDSAGVGLGVFDSNVTLERVEIQRSVSVGLHLQGAGTNAFATDVHVENTLADASGAGGANAVVTQGARLSGERYAMKQGQVVGLLVAGAGSSAVLSEALVSGTRMVCGSAGCGGQVAQGVSVVDGASVSLSRFRVSDNGGIGVVQGTGGQVDLAHGEVSFQVIGAVALDAAFDSGRLAVDVAYVGNEQKLSAVSVPLPKVPVFNP